MDAIEAIRNHPVFRENYDKLNRLEKNRMFCTHQYVHLLDVARIAYIHNLEEELGFRKEVVYAAALLHDIGKARQYEDGIGHETAGAMLAAQILIDLPGEYFTPDEVTQIILAIKGHRKKRAKMEVLEELLYRSDKQSRMCFACGVEPECDWDAGKKNFKIDI